FTRSAAPGLYRLSLHDALPILAGHVERELRRQTERLAKSLKVLGLMNVQYAIQGDQIYVLEVNPRASRTVPYVSKATGLPLAMIDRKSTRLNSSHVKISYAVFC